MLEIQHVEGLDEKTLNVNKRKTKKTQILLYDTQRKFDDFVNKLIYRDNGRYGDIPHFIISKNGTVYQILNTNFSSITFGDKKIDNKQIKIALENLGWLRKNTINGHLNNWIGDPYRAEPYIIKWRDHFYWDPYTNNQEDSLSDLINELCLKNDIPKITPLTGGLIYNPHNFKGILSKSNFSNIYTDINPSLNLIKLLNHEKK